MTTAQQKKVKELYVAQLIDRGWTKSLIAKHLGEPDSIKKRYGGGSVHFYLLERIKCAERRVTFKRALEKINDRRNRDAPVPIECDLLAAIFAVNRAAKRWRDAAAKHYRIGNHTLAKKASEHKSMLYELKDLGIAQAYRLGRISPAEIHGSLCLYCGEGYSFHSSLRPKGVDIAQGEDKAITIEAKPQGSSETKQRDAIFTLESLDGTDFSAFTILQVPKIKIETICYECREPGHISRDCPNASTKVKADKYELDDDDANDDEVDWA